MRDPLHRAGATICALAIAAMTAACQAAPTATPGQAFCDGIDAAVGGCDADRPSYAATTCAGVGHEFGSQLNTRLLAIYNGPDVANNETKAVRAGKLMSLAMSLANLHVRRIGIVATCGADEFLAAAESEFSPELKAKAGTYLADGPPVTYEEWLQNVRAFVELIDLDESTRAPASAT